MIINNDGVTFSNSQLEGIFNVLGVEYKPNKIVVYDKRLDFIRDCLKGDIDLPLINKIEVILGEIEGLYAYNVDTEDKTVYVFTFASEYKEKEVKQLHFMWVILHELRHCYQDNTKLKVDYELDSNLFATRFINHRGCDISNIMNWRSDWSMKLERV